MPFPWDEELDWDLIFNLTFFFFVFIEWKLCSGVRETTNHVWKSNVCNQRWWSQHSQRSYSCSANTCKRNLGLTCTFHFNLWPSFLLWRKLIFLLLQAAAAASEENENFENPVYASAVSASAKEPPQSTGAPQVGQRNAILLFCALNWGN